MPTADRISAPRWEKWRSTGEAIRKNICAAGGHTPHLKLFAMGPDGSYGKLSAVGSSGELTLDHALDAPATALPIVINTSAVCTSAALSRAVDEVVAVTTYMTECFDAAGPGRL